MYYFFLLSNRAIRQLFRAQLSHSVKVHINLLTY